MAVANGLLRATVFHKRLQPRINEFHYRVYYYCMTLQELESFSLPIFSRNRWNLFSHYEKDHGAKDGSSLESWIRRLLADFGVTSADGDIVLMAHPRLLGYVFNPISVWFCLDKQGALRAVLTEVRNTFGEHHNYLLFHPDQRPITSLDWLEAEKVFHVSPFMQVEGRYRFRFEFSPERVGIWINYSAGEGDLLYTSVAGKRAPLTTGSLMRAFFSSPLMTLKVIGLIHYQALHLWRKGIAYLPKPPLPEKETTR